MKAAYLRIFLGLVFSQFLATVNIYKKIKQWQMNKCTNNTKPQPTHTS